MRRVILIAFAALPLLGFDCGGPSPSAPAACSLSVAGAVSETFWCVATVYDYSRLDPTTTQYVFELAAYRGTTSVGAGVGFFLPARALVGPIYGWDSSTGASNVESGSASRYDATTALTHLAMAPMGDLGSGKLSVHFIALPAPTAPDAEMINVHGTLTATLPSTTTGGDVTFTATF